MRRSPSRRRFLQSTALAGVAVTAGCLARSTPGQNAAGDGSTPTTTPLSQPASLEEWLADANGYDGDVRRYGSQSRPEIAVGEPVDGEMSFAPPVIEVPPMTAVRWNWTGHGGQHNVVALDGTFDSGRTNAQPGTCYRYVFDEPGEYPFVSESRRDEGMKGAVIVAEPPTTGNEAVDEWLGDSGTFDGTIADQTGVETATVQVGAAGNGGRFAFDPPALRVSSGTTVAWKWSGEGGQHNVAFQDLEADSGGLFGEPGVHFEHTFERPGTYRYACEPHRTLGMKGAIVVE